MEDVISSLIGLFLVGIFYIPYVWGLYTINKKLGEKNPWVSFIPVLQFYSIIKASGKSLWWILWIFLIAIGIYLIFSLIVGIIIYIIISGSVNFMMLGDNLLNFAYNNIVLAITLAFILYILLITSLNTGYIIVLHSISKRTNRGLWTTVGLFFVPFIMFPIVGYKLKDQSHTENKYNKIDISEVKKEKTIEL